MDHIEIPSVEKKALEDTMKRILEHLEKIDADLECLKEAIKSPEVVANNISIMKSLCETVFKLCK